MHGAIEASMPFWTKEKWARVFEFSGKLGNSQIDKKDQTSIKQIFTGPPRSNGNQKEVPPTGSVRFLSFCHIQFM